VLCVLPVMIWVLSVTGRDAWSHAYQPGEIRNITEEEAKDYLVNRGIDTEDAEQLVKVPHHCQAISANCSFPVETIVLKLLNVAWACIAGHCTAHV
jgi:hypothetical protein